MIRKLTLGILTIFTATGIAFADGDVAFEAAAPRAVNAGELFRIEFVINATPSEFVPPQIEGFEVMAGPQESHSTNVAIVNGAFSKEQTMTYTYVLQSFTAGVHTISAAQAIVKGKTYSTKPISIEVVAGDSAVQGTGNSGAEGQQQGQQNQQGNTSQVAADDVFALVTVNRSDVYKGEPISVTLKLYSRVPLMLDDLKFPSFNGFWQQDISPDNVVQQRETYNNRVYDTWKIREYLLYPQQSGVLTIEPFDMTVTVRLQIKGSSPRNIFDELMGDGGNFQDIRKKLASQPLKINVEEWPAGAPDSFDGAVGQFTLEATPPQSAMNANTSGTYTVRISGTGNFPLIRAPKVELPSSFEEYNIKSSESYKHSRIGTTGYRQFEYPFIPRTDGSYTIPELKFSYFDPRQRRYVTLSSHELSLEVAADTTAVSTVGGGGIVSGLSKEDLKILGRDIRFIKLSSPGLRPKGKLFLWSPLYLSLMGLTVILFAAGLILLRKYVSNMQNDRFMRGKRANKVALKRFRAADISMKQDDRHGFYDEMLKALWGYMSDKLDIPMAGLTKERIREELFERSIPEFRSDEYIRIISDCEEAQYSPASSARMNELYKEGVNLVSELESAIKR